MNRIVAALALSALALTGCTSTQSAGNSNTAVTFNKTTGNIYTTVDRSLDDSFEASKRAMDDMGYTTQESSKDVMKGIVKAREADNSLVTVDLSRQSDKVTQIPAKVGPFGSETKSRLILDKIHNRLGR